MAVRYRSKEILSQAGEKFKVEISDADFSGTVFEFETARPGFIISGQGDARNRHQPICPTACEVVIYLTNPTLNNFPGHLAEGPEGRFTLAVYRWVSSAWSLFWAGVLQSEVTDVEDRGEPAFRVTAGDGLGLLRNVDYLNSGNPYTGHARLSEIVANCLKKIPHVPAFYGSADPFLVTSVNVYADQHSYAAAYDPLYYTSVDQEAFIKYDENGGYEVKNCYVVLEEVCKIMMSRLFVSEGIWRIEGFESRAFFGTSYYRKYAYAMGAPAAYTAESDLGGNPTRPRLATVMFGYLSPLQRARVKQYIGNLRNLIRDDQFSSDAAGPYTHTIFYDGLQSTIGLSGEVEWSFTNNSISVFEQGYVHYLMFYIYFKVGSLYLRRNFIFNNNGAVAGPDIWDTGGTYKFTTKPIWPIPDIGEETHDITTFNFVWEVDPSLTGQQITLIDFGFSAVYRSTGTTVTPSKYTVTWKVNKAYLTVTRDETDKADKINPKDSITYTAVNAQQVNTETYEIEVLLGDAEDLNPAGALRYYNGSTYEATEDWGMRAAGGGGKIAKLLAERILAGQTTPIPTYNGAMVGASVWKFAHLLRTEDGHQWFPAVWRFLAAEDTMDGQWWDLIYSDEVPTIEIPPYDPGLYELGRPPGIGLDGKAAKGLTANIATIGAQSVAALAFTFTDEPLYEGAVTQFDVTDALAANIRIGDELILVHPVTNESVVFTVTADVGDGDTTILATGTIPEGDFPANTPVVYGQQNLLQQGAPQFTLPDGVTDGDVLTWDSTTGTWGPEPAGTGSGTVTSVAMTVPTDILSVTGSPITTSGTLAVSKANQSANVVFAGPTTGAAAAPTFRALVTDDLSAGMVTYPKIQNVAGSRLLGNATGSAAAPAEIPLGTGLSFSGGSLVCTVTGVGASAVENGLTWNTLTSKINWGGSLVQATVIDQDSFLVTMKDGNKIFGKYNNVGANHSGTVSVEGTAGNPGTSGTGEDAVFVVNAYNVGASTQYVNELAFGTYITDTTGSWIQARSRANRATDYPIHVNPVGGKIIFGTNTVPSAYFNVYGNGLGTGNTQASVTLHVATTGEGSTFPKISLGVNDTRQMQLYYNGTDVASRINSLISGSTIRFSVGTNENDDKVIIMGNSSGRMGVGFSSTTGLHSTLQSSGSFAGAMLETSGAPTFDETKYCVVYTASTSITWTLPTASSCTGRVYKLHHAGSGGTITLSQSVSAGNGVTFSTLSAGEWATIHAGISNWRGKKQT